MATKTIKAWIDGAIQNIEVEDVISPAQPISVEERLDTLEDKHEVVITKGNFLVGDGTDEMEEMTPEEVLEHIRAANILTLKNAEYEALDEAEAINANTLYMITDADEDDIELIAVTDIDEICGVTTTV